MKTQFSKSSGSKSTPQTPETSTFLKLDHPRATTKSFWIQPFTTLHKPPWSTRETTQEETRCADRVKPLTTQMFLADTGNLRETTASTWWTLWVTKDNPLSCFNLRVENSQISMEATRCRTCTKNSCMLTNNCRLGDEIQRSIGCIRDQVNLMLTSGKLATTPSWSNNAQVKLKPSMFETSKSRTK